MRRNYNIKKLNPRPNPYAEKLQLQRKRVIIDMNLSTASYFETKADGAGVSVQAFLQSYLDECAKANG